MKQIVCLLSITNNDKIGHKFGTFESSIDLNNVFNFACKSNFRDMDYGSSADGLSRQVDKSVRFSEISEMYFDLGTLHFKGIKLDDKNFKIDRMYEFLRYNVGGHFEAHADRKRYKGHTHTICVYPPQDIDGGDLIIEDDLKIPMYKNAWIIVIFPIDMMHTCKPIISGTKYLFKGTAAKISKIIPKIKSTKNTKKNTKNTNKKDKRSDGIKKKKYVKRD